MHCHDHRILSHVGERIPEQSEKTEDERHLDQKGKAARSRVHIAFPVELGDLLISGRRIRRVAPLYLLYLRLYLAHLGSLLYLLAVEREQTEPYQKSKDYYGQTVVIHKAVDAGKQKTYACRKKSHPFSS